MARAVESRLESVSTGNHLSSGAQQLERMASELKCPICLNLFKQAAFLSCNHCFCNSCIVQSMRRTSCCPICKLPTSRREVRAAPQMDSLVLIFKGMESSAGINLSNSQPTLSNGSGGESKASRRVVPHKVTSICKKKTAGPLTSTAGNSGTIPARKHQRFKCRQSLSDVTNLEAIPGAKESNKRNSFACNPERVLHRIVPAKKRVLVPPSGFPPRSGGDIEANAMTESPNLGKGGLTGGSNLNPARKRQKFKCRKSLSDLTELNANHHVNQLATSPEKLPHRIVSAKRRVLVPCQGPPPKSNVVSGTNITPEASVLLQELQETVHGKTKSNHADKRTTTMRKLQTSSAVSLDDISLEGQELMRAYRDTGPGSRQQVLSGMQETSVAQGGGVGDTTTTDCSHRNPDYQHQTTLADLATHNQRGISPFFWLRDDTCSQEGPTQTQPDRPTQTQQPNWAPPQPAFSDLKGSSDHCSSETREENDNEVNRLVDGDSYNSEAFAWTQRPCSPELSCSPPNLNCAQPVVKLPRSLKPCSFPREKTGDQPAAKRCSPELSSSPPNTSGAKPTGKRPYSPELSCSPPNYKTGPAKRPCPPELSRNPPAPKIITCVFCGKAGDSEVAGAMVTYEDGVPSQGSLTKKSLKKSLSVHKFCAEWAPNVYFEGDEARNLAGEVARGQQIKCHSCKKKGAALGCFLSRCKKSYHYPCARALSGCQWDLENFIILCPQHASKKRSQGGKKIGDRRNGRGKDDREIMKFTNIVAAVGPQPNRAKKHHTVDSNPATSGISKSVHKWAPGPACKWVLCGAGIDSDTKKEMVSFSNVTGASVVKSWSSSVTHVITATNEQGSARRTMKYLLAILESKWIVKVEWMRACQAAAHAVEEEPYEVHKDTHGVLGGPKLSRSLAAAKEPKLLDGLAFYFCGDFTTLSKAHLQLLVTTGGGLVLHRKPLVETGSILQPPCRTVVIYDSEPPQNETLQDKKNVVAIRSMEARSMVSNGVEALPHTWLLNSVAAFRLQAR